MNSRAPPRQQQGRMSGRGDEMDDSREEAVVIDEDDWRELIERGLTTVHGNRPAGLADGLFAIARAINKLADVIEDKRERSEWIR